MDLNAEHTSIGLSGPAVPVLQAHDHAHAHTHGVGAGRVVMALSEGHDGVPRIVPATSADVRLCAGDQECADGAARDDPMEPWTVIPFPVSSQACGALLVRKVEGGRVLTEQVLRGFGRLIGLGPGTSTDVNTDAQTAALSRVGFDGALAAVLGDDAGAPWTVVSCDLNNFHLVNEFLGFRHGTALLRAVALRLLESVPSGAIVARACADHFLVAVPPQPDEQPTSALVAHLDQVLRQPVELAGEAICPSATFGSAVHRGGRSDVAAATEALIVAADHDLRLNKDRRDGRQHVAGSLDALRLDAAMHAAIAAGDITAYFQPLYDLATGELSGFEALARWTTPDGRSVPPVVFIPIAEGNGLIHALGEHMLDQVARLLMRYADEPHIVMHVNVSATQLASPGYATRFVQRFSNDASTLQRIAVEVTESKQIVDHDAVVLELQQLRLAGVGVALDDFGTGYSTLSQLHTIPATQMKIDKAFVQQALIGGTAVLEAMISLARAFRLRVVAEGVETVEQLRMVERLGCDRAQGYLFSRAVAPGALAQLPRTITSMLTAA